MSTNDSWPPPPPPIQYGYGGGYPQPPQQEGTAVGALVVAIVSWVICPVVPAIVALVMAASAKQKIEASEGRLTGLGLVTAARWVAAIHLALVVAVILFLVLLAVIGAINSSGSSTY